MKRLLLLVAAAWMLWPLGDLGAAPNYAGFGGATSPEYDVIVDLAHPEYLLTDNACDAFAAAVRPWIAGDITSNYSVLVHGRGEVDYTDFHDAGNFDRCFTLCKTGTYDANDHPLCDPADASGMHNGSLQITFNNATLVTDMDPGALGVGDGIQDEPAIIFMIGGGYEYGFSAAAPDEGYGGPLGNRIKIEGLLSWMNTQAVETAGWEDADNKISSPPYATSNDDASPTTTIGLMTVGANGVDMSGFRFVAGTVSGSDDDDIGLVSLSTNNLLAGSVSFAGMGVGAVMYGPQNGHWWSGQIAGNQFGLLFGDPIIGGNVTSDPDCDGAQCTTCALGVCLHRDSDVRQFRPRDTLMVESNEANVWMFDATYIDMYNVAPEHDATVNTEVGTCIGAGQDSVDPQEPCCVDADASSTSCVPASTADGNNALIGRVDFGGTKPISDKDSLLTKALGVGPTFRWTGAPYLSELDIRGRAFLGTTLNVGAVTDPLFTYDDDTASGYVYLDGLNWRYGTNLPPPGYKNIKFDEAFTMTWGATTTVVANDYCLYRPLTTSATGLVACSTMTRKHNWFAYPVNNEAYIHNCFVQIAETSGGLALEDVALSNWAAGDKVDLELIAYDYSTPAVTVVSTTDFQLRDNATGCAGVASCASTDGIYLWPVRGRTPALGADDGYLAVRLHNITDTGSNSVADIQVTCPEVSMP